MKKQPALRDLIYEMMDSIISHAKDLSKPIPAITLSNDQYQIFQDFNKPDTAGLYHYKDVLVKVRGTNVR